ATRMRRNAESLLVLAGIEAPRQWAAPMKVADVVRAALSEVEDYQRVVVRHLEPASITGAVAADVAHVLAELIENALSFSPPDQSVEVKGRLTTTGYTVAIADNGLGMTTDEVVRANRRLAGLESFTVAPSRYLGHYVAGHLASRMNVAVELQDSPAGGVTAKVDLPMGLLIDDELNRSLAKAPAAPAPEPTPVVAGPAASTVAEGTTTNGLARRGERKAPAPVADEPPLQPTRQPEPAVASAPTEPSTQEPPTLPMRRRSDRRPGEDGDHSVAPAAVPAAINGSPAPTAEPASPAPVSLSTLPLTQPGPSMYTLAAKMARPAAEANGATSSGLARRVPGAQRPDA
ncbi:MAG: ATP-binding protein, partial [Acidimicrobiales bacterium]|nr:ATP-binding protein [Acidimicrobiales bacterium]